ncbi:MAG: hypothetical protein NPIRA01_19830 [Nitrospirales bacterium]|nr:MAG: hypothetical protein NPIRA01_19830 [Nitrospirales bacterium]
MMLSSDLKAFFLLSDENELRKVGWIPILSSMMIAYWTRILGILAIYLLVTG